MAGKVARLAADVNLVCNGYQVDNNNLAVRFYLIIRGADEHELIVYTDNGQIISGYKRIDNCNINGELVTREFSYINKDAMNIYANILAAGKGCTSKNGHPSMHVLGACVEHTYKKTDRECTVIRYMGETVDIDLKSGSLVLSMNFYGKVQDLLATTGVNFGPNGLGLEQLYVELQRSRRKEKTSENEDVDFDLEDTVEEQDVAIRSLEEIALDKDITWLHNKRYYVINDEATAEKIFKAIENSWKGVVSYDVETSGLNINMFGKYGSERVEQLKKWNAEHPKERIKQDYLVGFSFTVEKDVGYYFPVRHRKFKNLYEDRTEGSLGLKMAQNIKSAYVMGVYRDRTDEMAEYIRKTDTVDLPCDVLLMERCRYIFENKPILAFNGIFEWKTTWLYNIDLNLKEDPMILHQLLYKFKRVRIGRGEPSNLKYLTKVECGVDQLDLADFFVGYKEDDSNSIRSGKAGGDKKKKSKKGLNIDFSWMDLRGTQAYAPADVDFALAIWEKYKTDLVVNYPEMEYIYNVEIIMACAVAYAEFYGLRINEDKIESVRKKNIVDICIYEHEFRKTAGLCIPEEETLATQLKTYIAEHDDVADDVAEEMANKLNALVADVGNLNMNAPGQVGELLYNKYKWPLTEDGKKSMGKKVIKTFEKQQDENGNLLYPEVAWYRKFKDAMTLDTKFFGKLREFTYPGGYMFANFGSISCSTGRMSCRTPNLQQMPKSISKIIEPRPNFVFCDADFAQIELRVLVAMAEELGLIEYFKDPDADMHSKLASMLFELPFAKVDIPDETGKSPRQQCKGLNFGIPYGMGLASLAITLYGAANQTTKAWAKAKYDKYFEQMPKVKEFFANVKEQAQLTEYTSTYFGRRRYYKFTDADGNYSNKYVAMALRQAGNAVIQGCIHGSTIIQTKEYGFTKIEDVVGKRLNVWDGTDWTLGDITDSGMKQRCIVTFSNGQKIECSPIHKFLVKSHKGNGRFVECRDLHSKEKFGYNAHRVVVNSEYVKSDYVYKSDETIKEGSAHNANNVTLDVVGDSFKEGVILGRLASDGSVFNREVGGCSIRQIVAEHEMEVADVLEEYMRPLNCKRTDKDARIDRNERITYIEVYSKKLVEEISTLDIKNKIHKKIMADTEMLRGFLRGLFDGDGGMCGKSIVLTFGGDAARASIVTDTQKALALFGIKSSIVNTEYHGHDIAKICIRRHDNQKFAEIIGFINSSKQKKAENSFTKTDGHIFGRELIVESVEITDDYVQMYDVCNTAGGYYVADGIVTHNTAADIFKIAMARIFTYIRTNHLIGKVLMSNFIHDEGLYEINVEELNVNEVLANIINCQQVQIKGFPPLTVGAGIGKSWAAAKGGMAEINPMLGYQIMQEGASVDPGHTEKEVYEYYEKLNENFRKGRIADYIISEQDKLDSGTSVVDINPIMAKLMTLAFDYDMQNKMQSEAKSAGLTGASLDKYMSNLDARRLRAFVENNPELFADKKITWIETVMTGGKISVTDVEEDVGYEDDEDDDGNNEISEYEFAIIDESQELFGLSIQDIIEKFGLLVSRDRQICGIDVKRFTRKQLDSIANLLEKHECDPSNNGAMEVMLLMQNRIIKRTGMWVSDITGDDINVSAATAC